VSHISILSNSISMPTEGPKYPNYLLSVGAGFPHLATYPHLIAADKTPYIEILDRKPKYQYSYLRPRRFGKSTFLQMLESYYDQISPAFLEVSILANIPLKLQARFSFSPLTCRPSECMTALRVSNKISIPMCITSYAIFWKTTQHV